MRIATFNMHHGKEDLVPYTHQAMVSSVDQLNADIVCLQETDLYSVRTRFVNQPKLIAKKLGYYYVSGFIRYFKLGFQQNAILSKYPILGHENILLPHVRGQQKRKALIASLEVDDRILNVATTHLHARKNILGHNEFAINQLDYLYRHCVENDVDIMAGDYNLLARDVLPLAEKYGFDAPNDYPTSPAKKPRFQIDWISASQNVSLSNVEVSPPLSSDHRALSADVE